MRKVAENGDVQQMLTSGLTGIDLPGLANRIFRREYNRERCLTQTENPRYIFDWGKRCRSDTLKLLPIAASLSVTIDQDYRR